MGLGKFIKRTVRKVENFAHRVTGQPNIGDKPADEQAPANKGPQFTEEARRRAAGAGTVGYTDRSQTP